MKPALVIFAYNRVDTLKVVLEAIDVADDAYSRNVYFFVDGGSDETVRNKVVNLCQEYSHRFLQSQMIVREENIGLKNNIERGLDYVFSREGSAIILEDDIVLSRIAFLYADEIVNSLNDNISCISLYQYPIEFTESITCISSMFCCWGWMTNKHHWSTYRNSIRRSTIPWGKYFEFNVGLYGTYSAQILANNIGVSETWFVHWYLFNFRLSKKCLYPSKSLAMNIGFNSAGTNCLKSTNEYDVVLSDNYSLEMVSIDNSAYKSFFRTLRINRFGVLSVIQRYLRILLSR